MAMKAILFTSFGVANERSRQLGIDAVASLLKEKYLDYEIRQAYTSAFIKKQLAKQGIVVDSLPEALAKLQQAGYQDVWVQPAHLTPGEEFDYKIVPTIKEYQTAFKSLQLGEPVFANDADYASVVQAILPKLQLAADEQLVWLGHGSPHRHNPVYEKMQAYVDGEGLPIHIGVVESTDTPDFAMVAARLEQAQAKKVLLAPLLLSGGVHANEDMAGDDDSSWKSRLQKLGLMVRTDLHGLAEYAAFRELYVKKIQKLLEK